MTGLNLDMSLPAKVWTALFWKAFVARVFLLLPDRTLKRTFSMWRDSRRVASPPFCTGRRGVSRLNRHTTCVQVPMSKYCKAFRFLSTRSCPSLSYKSPEWRRCDKIGLALLESPFPNSVSGAGNIFGPLKGYTLAGGCDRATLSMSEMHVAKRILVVCAAQDGIEHESIAAQLTSVDRCSKVRALFGDASFGRSVFFPLCPGPCILLGFGQLGFCTCILWGGQSGPGYGCENGAADRSVVCSFG